MSYLEDLTGYETKLEEFRGKVQDQLVGLKNDFQREDLALLKFLVARDLDVGKAEELFRKNVEWRQRHNVNQILHVKIPEVITDSFPYFYSGVDKRGYPILCDPVGRWKVRRVFKNESEATIKGFMRQTCEGLLELCRHLSERTGHPVHQYTTIFDMEGFDYSQVMSSEVIKVSRDIIQEYFDSYPELPCVIRIVNAPKLFQIVWSFVEPLLTGRTKSKIEIYSTNKEQWKPKLLELIDPDQLASRFGGAMTSIFDYRTEYGTNAFPKVVILPPESFREVTVAARQTHQVAFDLNVGDELAWNFSTVDYDIGFRVDRDGLNEPLFDSCRVDSHKFVQKGHFVCQIKSHYTLTFDNAYSKFKTKVLRYAVQHTKATGRRSLDMKSSLIKTSD